MKHHIHASVRTMVVVVAVVVVAVVQTTPRLLLLLLLMLLQIILRTQLLYVQHDPLRNRQAQALQLQQIRLNPLRHHKWSGGRWRCWRY